MVCAESMELETVWKRRHELTTHIEGGGLFAVSRNSHALMLRQYRAKQAQAANAILMHRKSCSICTQGASTHAAESLAS